MHTCNRLLCFVVFVCHIVVITSSMNVVIVNVILVFVVRHDAGIDCSCSYYYLRETQPIFGTCCCDLLVPMS